MNISDPNRIFLDILESISFYKENVKRRGHKDAQSTRCVYSTPLCPLCPRKRLCLFVFQKVYFAIHKSITHEKNEIG
jgi:hypothetical protein